jgi:Fe-S cluster biogenesis protein NfuA
VHVELLEVQGHDVRVRLTGLCTSCAGARLTMQTGLEEMLRGQIRDFGELQLVYE